MIEIELTQIQKVRFWLGELPDDARIPHGGVVRGASYDADGTSIAAPRAAAVELYMPMTPRRYYALLGATLVPQGNASIVLEVSWSLQPDIAPSWALDSQVTRRGLTEAEARSVAGVPVPSHGDALAGVVEVTHALTSDVDTSPVVLAAVTTVLLEILCHPAVAESDKSLRALTAKAVRERILVPK